MTARNNPFASEHVIALPFVFEADSETTWARLEALNRRGAIVGPCGTGKTTLLEATQLYLEERGLRVTLWRLNTSQRRFSPQAWQQTIAEGDALLVDGIEQLHLWEWHRLRHHARRASAFVVTSHHHTSLPLWIQTTTSPALLQHLVKNLGHEMSDSKAAAVWSQHNGNLRLALWQLYDEFAACGG